MFAQTLNVADNLNNMIDSMITSPVQTPISRSGAKQNAYKLRKNKSAYMFFSAEIREDYKQRGVQLGPNEMMKAISENWKSLSKQQKAKYEAIAKQDKERYTQEKEELMRIDPSLIVKNKTKKNHVKKALSAYDFFMKEMYKKMKAADPSLYSADIVKAVSKEWKNLTEGQKAVYQEKAKIDKEEKWAQLQALELNKRSEGSPLSDETEEEFLSETRKQLRLEDSTPKVVNPLLIPSFNVLEESSQAKKTHAKSIYTFEMPEASPCTCCTMSPSSLSISNSNGLTSATAFTSAFSDYTFSPASQFGDLELNFSSYNTSHAESPVAEPLVATNTAVGIESLDLSNFDLSLNRFDSFFNLGLSKMPSFRHVCSHREPEDLASTFIQY